MWTRRCNHIGCDHSVCLWRTGHRQDRVCLSGPNLTFWTGDGDDSPQRTKSGRPADVRMEVWLWCGQRPTRNMLVMKKSGQNSPLTFTLMMKSWSNNPALIFRQWLRKKSLGTGSQFAIDLHCWWSICHLRVWERGDKFATDHRIISSICHSANWSHKFRIDPEGVAVWIGEQSALICRLLLWL